MQKILKVLRSVDQNTVKKILYVTSILLFLTSIYHFYYARRIIPGVVVGNTKIGGKNYAGAKRVLESSLYTSARKLILKYNDKTYEIGATDLGLDYNVDASLSRAFEVGRTGNVLIDSKDKIAGLVKPLFIKFFYTFNNDALTNELNLIKGEINTEPQDASFVLENKALAITPSIIGKKADDETLYMMVVNSFDRLEFGSKNIIVHDIKPKVKEDSLKDYYDDAQKILENPLKIIEAGENGKEWVLTKNQLLDFITVSFDNSGNTDGLTLNKPKFENYVELLSQEVNRLPRGRVVSTTGNLVTGFELISDGSELDVPKFTADFKKALLEHRPTVQMTMVVINKPESKEKYGIRALLGSGKSRFTGSANARIHNLSLAAERTSGVLVAPGAVYSFNNSVGDINGSTGYDTAYIISNGRTVLGEGGGVCQTSTTLFRAVLNAGLPVVKRYPHAYRVSYYELDSPVGLDASIFQPSLDFQFKNDTANYVLVQSAVDTQNQTLEFKLYGTPDGREVKMTDPVITNVVGAPAPLYQDAPSLPKGYVRQVDFSAPGASVYFTREVTRNGKVIISDTFSSRYQAWRAVFLVGTKN